MPLEPDKFKIRFGHVYDNAKEEARRFVIFKKIMVGIRTATIDEPGGNAACLTQLPEDHDLDSDGHY